MASGAQLAKVNVAKFEAWAAGKCDSDFERMRFRESLSRVVIHRECGFSKSVLVQNPKVAELLANLEAELRQRGILPPLRDSENVTRPDDAVDMKSLISESALENAELKSENPELKRKLETLATIHSIFVRTGRIPR